MVMNMLIRIKKMQFIVGICLILQIIFSHFLLPFHFIATFLSVIIILWQKKFRVLQIQYHYYVIALYIFRLFLLLVIDIDFLFMLYIIFVIYVSIMLILLSCKTFL